MLRKLVLGLVLGALLIAAPTSATAASSKTVSSSGNVLAAVVGTVNGQITVAGYLKDPKYGVGTVLFNRVLVGKGAKSPFTVFFAGGSFGGTATFDAVAGADGVVTISTGELAIKKVSGSFKGATGTGTVKGTSTDAGQFKLSDTLKITKKSS